MTERMSMKGPFMTKAIAIALTGASVLIAAGAIAFPGDRLAETTPERAVLEETGRPLLLARVVVTATPLPAGGTIAR